MRLAIFMAELGALCRLITECERDADGRSMRLVFIGDYIDRGPDSRGVVDYIIDLQSRLGVNAICLMGNHEALALSAIDDLNTENWILNGGLRSNDVSSALELPAAHVAWLRSLRLAFDDGLRFAAIWIAAPRKVRLVPGRMPSG